MSSKKSSSTLSAAADIIGGNDDLLIEIFLFLPARPLVRLKLVSKRWRSLISAPSFCHRHTLHHSRRHPETQHSFILRASESLYFVCHPTVQRLTPFRFGFASVIILQSCNGLLLLSCAHFVRGRKHYCVFNPTTMQCRELSLPPCSFIQGLCLMFDPRISLHYRVVGFLHRANTTLFYVYESETLEWRCGGVSMNSAHARMSFRNGIYFNGGIYLHRVCSSSYRFIPDDDLSVVPDPPRGRRNYAAESNGVLLSLTLSKNVLLVHETKDIESGWTKRFSADLNQICASFGATNIELLGMVRGEKEEDSLLMLSVVGKIVIYRFRNGDFEVLVDFTSKYYLKKGCLQFKFKDAHQFVHSFAPV